jgi:hypothetical protein
MFVAVVDFPLCALLREVDKKIIFFSKGIGKMARVFDIPESHPSLFSDSGRVPSFYNISLDTFTNRSNKFDNAKDLPDIEMYSVEKFDTPHRSILTGIQELSPFSKAFFSRQNIDWIQTNMRYEVYNKTERKYVISVQDETNLLIIMRAIYLQNSTNPRTHDKQKAEILRLNQMVIDYSVPHIIEELLQYRDYLNDISANAIPLERPKNVSVAGTKTYGGPLGFSDVLGL